MKNNLVISVAVGLSLCLTEVASAQSIAVDELGSAQMFDAGVLDIGAGGLDPSLWQATSAKMAAKLISVAPVHSDVLIIRDLVQAAVLSGGVPPVAATAEDEAAYRAARVRAAMAFGNTQALDTLIARAPQLATNPRVQADIALSKGDTARACNITDGVQEGRAEPAWAKLRAFCHVVRDEAAAAELTVGLLKSADYTDKDYYAVMNVLLGISKTAESATIDTPLLTAMAVAAKLDQVANLPSAAAARAQDTEVSKDDRLAALFAGSSVMTDAQIKAVFSDLAFDVENLDISSSFDLDSALAASAPQGTAQLSVLALSGGSAEEKTAAMAALLARADAAAAFDRFAEFLQAELQFIPANLQAEADLKLFARAAVNRGDISALQGFFQALPEGSSEQARIALVADALGNGFMLGELGKDIEGRLRADGEEKTRAFRDAFIAVALGARVSEAASDMLDSALRGKGRSLNSGALLALGAVAEEGSRAETVLRVATLMAPSGPTALDDASLADIIKALRSAGLDSYAGRIAAQDFLSGLAER